MSAAKSKPVNKFTLHHGDARDAALLLADVGRGKPFLTCTVTSPPYGDLIDYGADNQIGRGQSYEEYLRDCAAVFAAAYEYTLPDGSLWIVADTVFDQRRHPSAMRPLPFDLARVAEESGWTLRDTIIWDKEKTRPWSNRGRLRNAFEYVLFLVKTNDYKYNVDRLRDPIELAEWWVQYPERYNPQGKAPTNLWRIPIPVQGTWANTSIQHACPLPPELVERVLLLSTDPKDVVFDPFAGSGTVLGEAERLGRRVLGLELNNEYVKTYRDLVRPELLERRGDDVLQQRLAASAKLQVTILNLRAVKYPKTLFKRYAKLYPGAQLPSCAIAIVSPALPETLRNKHQLLEVTTIFVLNQDQRQRQEVQLRLKDIAARKPLTGFGVDGEILVLASDEVADAVGRRRLYLYEHGRTWTAVRRTNVAELLQQPTSTHTGKYLPIASNVELDEKPRRVWA